MQTPARIHRAHVENRLRRLPLSEKQREREERIVAATQTLMACFADDVFTIPKIALALRMMPGTVRLYYLDVESILAEILVRHLREISRAIGRIPHDHPNRQAAQRAAYMEVTRTGWGAFTEPHFLLIEKRKILPDDLARPIEHMRQCIGEALGGENAEAALMLLDSLDLEAPEIEAMLARTQSEAAAPAEPAEPPAPAPAPHKPHFKDWKLARRLKAEAKRQARAARSAAEGERQPTESNPDPPGAPRR
jgi:AcrR family transcriptional regulator